jgi:SAM-dependent methyltransferase
LFLDLGTAPPSNAYLDETTLNAAEARYPLKLYVCAHCWLVQTQDFVRAETVFDKNYSYFSSISRSWLDHAARYVEMIVPRLGLGDKSNVVEIASNDGYLLKNFVALGIPSLGIEPTSSTAQAARALGVEVQEVFFNDAVARELVQHGKAADLVIGNNVYAHVPDINDFTTGLKTILKPEGTITLEFPHLMRLIEQRQFDTVYHEHFSYLSLNTVAHIFAQAGLAIYDVEELPTHGGSLRVYGCHEGARQSSPTVSGLLEEERRRGMTMLATYAQFQALAEKIRVDFVAFLNEQGRKKKTLAAYGAAAKGNTLLNFAGITTALLPYVCDAAPSKQGKYLPGSHIPILAPDVLRTRKPDIVLILPWNIADEVMEQLAYVREWGGRFAIAIPKLKFL